MSDVPLCPAGFLQFPGMAPDGHGTTYFVVAKAALLGHFRDTRNRHKQLEGLLVPEVVESPTGVWLDLKSPGKKDWLCYAGLPEGRYVGDISIEVPRPQGQVMVVYIRGLRAADGQWVVDFWEWVEDDKEERGLPVDHASRYGSNLWLRD